MALTKQRDTKRRELTQHTDPIAADTKIFAGALTCLDASGNVVPGATATTLKARGRAEETVDNTGGSAGDLSVRTTVGVFCFKNSGSDPVDRADIGNDCYIVDDETVAATNGTNTRSKAGRVTDVDGLGVWVEIR